MNALEYVKNLGTGWNLGNTLDAHPKCDDSPLGQEQAWRNPITTEAMIKMVKDAGFDIFRVPTTWCKQLDENHRIKPEFMARVKEVVNFGYNNGMTVILNLHHEDWHFPTDENFPAATEILQKLWTQIATEFGEYDDRLIFEAMNEPRKTQTPVEWTGGDEEGRRVVMQLNQIFVDTVRATGGRNATRMLMVPNYAASCAEVAMADFVMPRGENIIMSLHGYIPYDFALGDDHSLNKWSPELEEPIDELFTLIDKYFISRGIPVIMGECGARKKHGNAADRAKWAAYYAKKAREYDIPCVWWDNGYLEGTEKTEVFGLLNRHELKWEFPEIVQAFLGGNGQLL